MLFLSKENIVQKLVAIYKEKYSEDIIAGFEMDILTNKKSVILLKN